MKLSLISNSILCRIGVMGLPGSGKTTLVASLAEAGMRLHWFDLEDGAETLKKLSPAAKENVELYRIPDSASYPIASQSLLTLFKNGKGNYCEKHFMLECALCKKAEAPRNSIDFSTLTARDIVVVDTATQLGMSILAHLTKNKPVDYKPERDDWGGLRKFSEFFASQWQGFTVTYPCNLIVIFHTMEAAMEDGRSKMVPAFGSAPMSASIGKAFSHLIYTDVVNRKHVAYSSSTYSNNVLTKSRTDFEIEKLAVPSLYPLFEGLEDKTNTSTIPIEGEATRVIDTAGSKDSNSPAQNAVVNLARLSYLKK